MLMSDWAAHKKGFLRLSQIFSEVNTYLCAHVPILWEGRTKETMFSPFPDNKSREVETGSCFLQKFPVQEWIFCYSNPIAPGFVVILLISSTE